MLTGMMKTVSISFSAAAAALAAMSLSVVSSASAEPVKATLKGDARHAAHGAPPNARQRVARISCSSGDYRKQVCRLDVGFAVRDARLIRQHSNADCDRGEDWGLQADGLWVAHGCRGEFEVSGRAYKGNGRGYGGDDYSRRDTPYHNRHAGADMHNARHEASDAAIAACAREGAYRAWDRGRYSAQYTEIPYVRFGDRSRVRVIGDMQTLGARGFRRVRTNCLVIKGRVAEFGVERLR